MEKILNLLGLARRAGKLACGARLCEDAVKNKRAKLVILACDASKATQKEIMDCCEYYKTEYIKACSVESMGQILGMGECAAVAVTDLNFADGIKKNYKTNKYLMGKER